MSTYNPTAQLTQKEFELFLRVDMNLELRSMDYEDVVFSEYQVFHYVKQFVFQRLLVKRST